MFAGTARDWEAKALVGDLPLLHPPCDFGQALSSQGYLRGVSSVKEEGRVRWIVLRVFSTTPDVF